MPNLFEFNRVSHNNKDSIVNDGLSIVTKDLSIIAICDSNGMLLQGMDEHTLLFKDEHLIPNIDDVLFLSLFWKDIKMMDFS